MDSLPQIPAEMIGSSDFLDVSVLRLVSRKARSIFTPCAARITIVPGPKIDPFLSSMTNPFSNRTVVRLMNVWECMPYLDKYPALWRNIRHVICTETTDRHSQWLPLFNRLFPNVESFNIEFEEDDEIQHTFVVGPGFSRFNRDLTIDAFETSIEANLTVQNLMLRGMRLRFDPTVHIIAENASFVGTAIDEFPASLTVQHKLCLDECHIGIFTDMSGLGHAFRTATDVSLISGDALRMAHQFREGMAARTLVLELESYSHNQSELVLLPEFFAEGPLLVERLTLRGAPLTSVTSLYGLTHLRYLDLTPSPSTSLRAPPAGLVHLIVRLSPGFFGRDILFMMTYVGALRIMCRSQGVLRLSVYLYEVSEQSRIRGEPAMTIHEGAP